MKITDYRIRIIDRDNMLASFEINFDYALTVRDILLLSGKEGRGVFIAVPSKQFQDRETGEPKYRDYIEFSGALKEYLRKFCEDLYHREKREKCS